MWNKNKITVILGRDEQSETNAKYILGNSFRTEKISFGKKKKILHNMLLFNDIIKFFGYRKKYWLLWHL